MNSLFSFGSKKPLQANDLPKTPYNDTCDPINEKFERYKAGQIPFIIPLVKD